ncbi:hypothetical protein EVAR_40735_1 [Eumeta japonica]|uniref:Uncharacterized protein n=1 Tax=Eumeta variegata TaxID=151549 RepID=A0A4C1X3E4_EUMVA|nr:hypothetical protein EVAR_40735_1 [Eumeta japonica]
MIDGNAKHGVLKGMPAAFKIKQTDSGGTLIGSRRAPIGHGKTSLVIISTGFVDQWFTCEVADLGVVGSIPTEDDIYVMNLGVRLRSGCLLYSAIAARLSAVHATADEETRRAHVSLFPDGQRKRDCSHSTRHSAYSPRPLPTFRRTKRLRTRISKPPMKNFTSKKLRVKALSGYAVSPREYTKWIAVCSSVRTDDTALHQPRSDAKKVRKNKSRLPIGLGLTFVDENYEAIDLQRNTKRSSFVVAINLETLNEGLIPTSNKKYKDFIFLSRLL